MGANRVNATIPASSLTAYGDGARWSEGSNEFMSVQLNGAVTLGDVKVIAYDAQGPTAAAAASSTFDACGNGLTYIVGVATITDISGNWSPFQTRGFCEASVEGTTDVAAGDFLEVLNAEDDFKKDGTAKTENSAAIAVDAQATNSAVVATVFLLGEPVIVAAS